MLKKTPFEENNQSIRDLLNSIIPESKIDSIISSHKNCFLFLDIESYSLINKYIDFILWIIFFLIMDFIIFMQSFPSNFFTTVNRFVSNGEQNSPKFIEIRFGLQQATILINITIFFFVIYQWYKFFSYKSNKYLNHKTATFLHFTVMYFPIIMVPILGIFFGANIITNESKGIKSRDGILLSIYVLISAILLLINHLIYTYFVNYSLILKNSFFAYWNTPFRTIDLIYFFTVSLLFTFRSGQFDVYTTISGALGIIYGIWSIYRFKYTVFIFSTGKFCFLKILLDSILLGANTIINIWVKISFLQSSIAAFILFLSVGLVSYLIIGPGNEKIKSDLSYNNNTKDFPTSKIRNADEALFRLRNGITFSSTSIADPNFIQFLVQNRFSPDLITDVVRLSIYTGIDLSSIIIPKTLLSPFDLNPLKYMAFQYKLFENMIKRDKIKSKSDTGEGDKKEQEAESTTNHKHDKKKEDLTISDVCHRLEQEKARAEEILDTFWTENDSKQLNIYQLGQAIKDISNEFSMYGSIFKEVESIQNLWHSFVIDVLAMPSAQKIHPNALDMFVYPRKGLLTYLIEIPKKQTVNGESFDHNQQIVFNDVSKPSSDQSSMNLSLKMNQDSQPSNSEVSTTDFSEFEIRLSTFHNKSHFFNTQPLINKNMVKKRPAKSELEKYFRSFQYINIRPILILFVIITVLTFLSAIIFGVNSNHETRESLEEIVDIFDLMMMALTVSGQLASTLDSFITYPNTEVISTILAIPIGEARVFRSSKIPSFYYGFNLYDKLDKIPIPTTNITTLKNCPTISNSLIANYKLPEDSTFKSRKCYYYDSLYFTEQIKMEANLKIDHYHDIYTLKLPDYAILLIYLSIFIVIFILFYFIFERRMHNYFLKAVAHISCSGSNKNFTERTDFSFSFFVQFLIFLLILSCTVMMYYGHSLPLDSLKKKSRDFSNITFSTGLISIRIQEVMSSILLLIMNNLTDSTQRDKIEAQPISKGLFSVKPSSYFSSVADSYSFKNLTNLIYNSSVSDMPINDLISLFCREIIFFVNWLTFSKGFPQSFNSIPLIDIWFNKDGLSYETIINDWATFGTENITHFTPESFKGLYMRYVYMNTFVEFIQKSFPQAIEMCFIEMMKNTFTDWYITILSIIFSFIFLSLYAYIHKRKKIWFYGASLLLRRRITKDQRFIVIMRHILESGKIPECLDLLPFAAVVKDENNIIIDSNWRVQKFTKLTTRQLVGQNFNDIFMKKRMLKVNPRDVEITEIKNNKNQQDLIVLRENSGIESIKENLNKIVNRFNFPFDFEIGYNNDSNVSLSKNNLIILHNAVYIEVKLENGIFKPEESFSLFNQVEETFHSNNDKGWTIRRLSCGAMYYTALCYFSSNENETENDVVFDENNFLVTKKKIFLFLSDLFNQTHQSNAIIAATMGKISCYSLTPESNPDVNINTIAAGKPVLRAHDICLYGTMGRLYIDFELLNFASVNKEDMSFLFIQKQEKRKKRVTFLLNENTNSPSNVNVNNNDHVNDDVHVDIVDNDNDSRPDFYALPEWILPVMPI
ncbi:hypothetical protein M9Y10_011282 [Tritrichomonas musculus]|uniref:PAS domain-containing protein n=1 Tax=Tritrichomonas musculus TaxID=1915356 RepID=A0ABR2IJR6_9EUKA